MIEVEGYKAFRGRMRITPKTNFHAPYDITGQFLYKPATGCWYNNGVSYSADVCFPLSENTEYELKEITETNQKTDELYNAALPLHDFLCKYYHPHATIILTQDSVEVLEGSCAHPLPVRD